MPKNNNVYVVGTILISIVLLFLCIPKRQKNIPAITNSFDHKELTNAKTSEWERYVCPENKVADIDLSSEKEKRSESHIVKLYGEGCSETAPEQYGRHRRYYNPKTDSYVDITFEGGIATNVLITQKDIVSKACHARQNISTSTGKGIVLGDSPENVEKIYGTPYIKRSWLYQKGDLDADMIAWRYMDIMVPNNKNMKNVEKSIPPGFGLNFVFKSDKVFIIELISGE